ncbi:MAG: RloB family protein [Egibacteraceae bacterium]
MTRRENVSRRSLAHREPKVRILIVCGGLRTEPDYFNELKKHLRNPAVTVRVKARGRAPENLVQYACSSHVAGADEFDQVWCVVDVDEFPLDKTTRDAAQRDIRLAVSNPCFELWLLLHRCDWHKPLVDAKAAHRELERYVATYDKDRLRFSDFVSGVEDAVRRGEQLDSTGCDHHTNPSSGVWKLVQLMRYSPRGV